MNYLYKDNCENRGLLKRCFVERVHVFEYTIYDDIYDDIYIATYESIILFIIPNDFGYTFEHVPSSQNWQWLRPMLCLGEVDRIQSKVVILRWSGFMPSRIIYYAIYVLKFLTGRHDSMSWVYLWCSWHSFSDLWLVQNRRLFQKTIRNILNRIPLSIYRGHPVAQNIATGPLTQLYSHVPPKTIFQQLSPLP